MKKTISFIITVLFIYIVNSQNYMLKPIVEGNETCFCRDVYSINSFQDKVYVGGWIKLAYIEGNRYYNVNEVTVGASGGASINALKVLNNKLYFAGGQLSVNNSESTNIGYFDGENWEALPKLGSTYQVNGIEEYNNEIYAIGDVSDGVGEIGKLKDDGTWEILPNGPRGGNSYAALKVYNNELYAVGHFDKIGDDNNSITVSNIAKWDGVQWTKVGDEPLTYYIGTLYIWNNKLITSELDVWDGMQWTSLTKNGMEENNAGEVEITGFAEYDNKLFAVNFYGIYYYDEPNSTWVKALNDSLSGYPFAGLINSPIVDGLYTSYSNSGNGEPHILTKENLSVNDTTIEHSLIYPNPTQNFVNIKSNKKVKSVQVYSADGKLIKSSESTNQISLLKLPKGVYSFNIQFDDNSIEIKKVVKK